MAISTGSGVAACAGVHAASRKRIEIVESRNFFVERDIRFTIVLYVIPQKIEMAWKHLLQVQGLHALMWDCVSTAHQRLPAFYTHRVRIGARIGCRIHNQFVLEANTMLQVSYRQNRLPGGIPAIVRRLRACSSSTKFRWKISVDMRVILQIDVAKEEPHKMWIIIHF